jgi:hypothetical protein
MKERLLDQLNTVLMRGREWSQSRILFASVMYNWEAKIRAVNRLALAQNLKVACSILVLHIQEFFKLNTC